MARTLRHTSTDWLKRRGVAALKVEASRRLAFRLAAARGRRMVLLWHRVSSNGGGPHEVVPNVAVKLFREQLEALRAEVEIVSLSKLLEVHKRETTKPRVALTFDDDEASHAAHVLPILRSLDLPATFFLSGRSLHGRGPYWWMTLERILRDKGSAAAAQMLGVTARSPRAIAAECEGTSRVEQLTQLTQRGDGALLAPDDIRTLADVGMSIGFHTLEHHVLPTLSDDGLTEALRIGRAALESCVSAQVQFLAYPHGRCDERVAEATRNAGVRAAFVSGSRPISTGSDPFRLGRWEPGAITPDALLAELALRLHHPLA